MDEQVIDGRRVITSMGYSFHTQLTFTKHRISHDKLQAEDGSYELLPKVRQHRDWTMKLGDDISVEGGLRRQRSFEAKQIEKILYDLVSVKTQGRYATHSTAAHAFVVLKTDPDPKPFFTLQLDMSPEGRWQEATGAVIEKVLEAIEERYGIPYEHQDHVDCKVRRLVWRRLLLFLALGFAGFLYAVFS